MRQEADLPLCTSWGWKYHHVGIPTKENLVNGTYIPHLKFAVQGFSTSPFGIEWMKFDEDCAMPEIIQKYPHVAFEVADIEAEIKKHNLNVIVPINSPSEGIKVAMIEHNHAAIELIEFACNL